DGLMDLIIADHGYYQAGGNYPSKFLLLENTGTVNSPAFTVVTDDYHDLSTSGIGQSMYPAFGDIDGDGDQDMYIGDQQGRLHHFENISTTPVAEFQLAQPNVTDANSVVIDVGQFATPQFFDVDGDGLLDLLVGERNGNVNYYRNQGTQALPSWNLEEDTLGGLTVTEYWNITGHAVPFMFLNQDGEREMLVGSESGAIHHWTGIEGNLTGPFTLADSTFGDIDEGMRSAVALHDFHGTGDLDLVTGNYRGGIGFWRNDFSVGIAGEVDSDPLRLFPNPADEGVDVVLDRPAEHGSRLQLFSSQGRLVLEVPARGQRIRVGTSQLANGIYLLRMTGGPWEAVHLVVQH
ncbi:MAG: T9SS type A sorting domain-containing protein, partial [Flavobacteriales bacterium]|nr:T9SS type A sorting domain-containing protein [Flavobacteriales bacterium]